MWKDNSYFYTYNLYSTWVRCYKNIKGTNSIKYLYTILYKSVAVVSLLPVFQVGCCRCSLQSGPHPHCSRHIGWEVMFLVFDPAGGC